MENLFFKAAKRKYRFKTSKGLLSIEQLFELNKTQLNELYLSLETNISKSSGLLGVKGNKEVEEKLEIVKHVFDDLVEEQERKEKRVANKALKQKIYQKIEEKKEGKLDDMKLEDLEKMAKELDD